VAGDQWEVRMGYQSTDAAIRELPVTVDDNLIIADFLSPFMGQPVVFMPGRFRDVFRIAFDVSETVSARWLLDGSLLEMNLDMRLCRDRAHSQVRGFLQCVQPPATPGGPALARFGYVNPGDTLTLPARSSRNYFRSAGGIFSPLSQRGQPTVFESGVRRDAFDVLFDPLSEPLLTWEIDGEIVPAALDLPGVPLCTPLSQRLFVDGFEALA
jgi:hypothetical protein